MTTVQEQRNRRRNTRVQSERARMTKAIEGALARPGCDARMLVGAALSMTRILKRELGERLRGATKRTWSKATQQRHEAELALRHAKRAMAAAGMSADQAVGFIRQVDDNCAGPCKTAKQAYGSLIWALADQLLEAEKEAGLTEEQDQQPAGLGPDEDLDG